MPRPPPVTINVCTAAAFGLEGTKSPAGAGDGMWELIGSIATVVTAVVVAISAYAALVQLRHLRDANELGAVLALERDFQSPSIQAALRYVQEELATRMEDPAYRARLSELGFVDPHEHPEMELCNWFDQMGTMVKNGLVDQAKVLDLFNRLVSYYWRLLAPTIAVLRRKRGASQYENFEYVAVLSQRWRDKHPQGTYPSGMPRLDVPDPWRAADEASAP
jgi:hypothetical protein